MVIPHLPYSPDFTKKCIESNGNYFD
ncbi:hypothetical protein WH47_10933 [Habropoda laboriosa]|uniref:Histone-lysine N-methyltransferase SETMAR n=1 Tax=Habropoda laboriosa TaxID=597456 RepID=A0A0L7QKG2_9HYME|nr:hypothetical protein WH47_10933 [Habropoda laboriosa]